MKNDYGIYTVRKSIIADPGFKLMLFDYDQQEMIVMLDQAEAMPVIEKLKSGEYKDFYLATGAIIKQVMGIELIRQILKGIALGLAYGQGKALLAKNLGVTLEQSEKFKNAFFRGIPEILKLKNSLESQVNNYGKIHNAFGRVIYLTRDESYKALNAFVQSTSADITKKAMIDIAEKFAELRASHNIKSRLSLCVHDELIFNMFIGEEKLLVPIIIDLMSKAYPFKHIPLTVGASICEINAHGVSSWGEKIDYKVGE